MIIRNKLDKTFGPFGSSTGLFLVAGGFVATYFSISGLLIVLIGAFAAFTSTSTFIDADNRRIKYSDNLFGFLPVGKWLEITPDMKLGLRKSHRGFTGYIRVNQPLGISENDIRIFLYDSNNKQIMPVNKFSSLEAAQNALNNLSSLLRIPVVPRKN